jgi:hypothetical protein
MSLAADALQVYLVRDLILVSGRAPLAHLADVITDAPRAGYDLDFDGLDSSIQIDFREPLFVAAAIAGDAARFSAACFTTMTSIEAAMEQPETFAWALVRMYYAAFYGGHAFIRLSGLSCSQIDSRHVTRLRSLYDARGIVPTFPISSGLYRCSLNPAQTGFSMTMARGRVGGAHEAFWEIFDAFISEAANGALAGRLSRDDSLAVFSKLESLRKIHQRGAGASWLSAIRNEIQYRHARGAWSPLSVNRTGRTNLSRLASQWSRDPMDIDIEAPPCGELGAFVAACAFTSALCRTLLRRVADRSSVGAASFARYPLRLCP